MITQTPAVIGAVVLTVALACLGCANSPALNNASRQNAVRAAERVLAARNLPLPHAYKTEVAEDEVISEMVPQPRAIYHITFLRDDGKKGSRIYRVTIGGQSGKVEGIVDFRRFAEGISR